MRVGLYAGRLIREYIWYSFIIHDQFVVHYDGFSLFIVTIRRLRLSLMVTGMVS